MKGKIVWTDLTVPNASEVKSFYESVAGWQSKGLSMGEYDDYVMKESTAGETVAGICHARGMNANVPPQWMIYIQVDSVTASAAKCIELGGQIIDGPRAMGKQHFCVIRAPAGAVAGLISDAE